MRVVGSVGPDGGKADVSVDGERQLAGVDFWNPRALHQQIVYWKNGLAQTRHSLRVVARGDRNPLSGGTRVWLDAVQYSDAAGDNGFGQGGGPAGTQRVILGYPERFDYTDTRGSSWKPGTEFVARSGHMSDAVARTWWTMSRSKSISGTTDPVLYMHGAHWPDFVVNFTVAPGTYHVRLKFAETQYPSAGRRSMTVSINGRNVVEGFDVFATAGGANKAVDLVYDGIQPRNGIIDIRFQGSSVAGCQTEAMVQAIEVGPGDGGQGAVPKTLVR